MLWRLLIGAGVLAGCTPVPAPESGRAGKLLLQSDTANGHIDGLEFDIAGTSERSLQQYFEQIKWTDPNKRNLVAEGKE